MNHGNDFLGTSYVQHANERYPTNILNFVTIR